MLIMNATTNYVYVQKLTQFHHENRQNRGRSSSRNLGIKNSTQNFIAFLDADDYHSKANIEKMSTGTPLNDQDRLPWLESLY